jgi:Caspase domain
MVDETDSLELEMAQNNSKLELAKSDESAVLRDSNSNGDCSNNLTSGSLNVSEVIATSNNSSANGAPRLVEHVESSSVEVDARPLSKDDITLPSSAERPTVDARPVSSTEIDALPFTGNSCVHERPPSLIPTDRESNYYNLEGNKLAVVFNHKQFNARFELKARRGTEADVKAIKKTFQSLGWEVKVVDDAKLNEIKETIKDIQNSGTGTDNFPH